jgi:hypothetical protein
MTSADWRALLEAYLDGRLSAEAFMRRFIEGWSSANGRAPRAILDLQPHVEAFESQVREAAEEGAVSDDELRNAAQRALANLSDETPVHPHTFDRTRAREEMRRFQMHVTGCAGVGCTLATAWIVLCLIQIVFVSEWVQNEWGWSAWPSAFVGFFLAFVPIVGNVLAFIDATEIRGWPTWLAALVFFAAPAVTIFSGWTRWRRPGPRG